MSPNPIFSLVLFVNFLMPVLLVIEFTRADIAFSCSFADNTTHSNFCDDLIPLRTCTPYLKNGPVPPLSNLSIYTEERFQYFNSKSYQEYMCPNDSNSVPLIGGKESFCTMLSCETELDCEQMYVVWWWQDKDYREIIPRSCLDYCEHCHPDSKGVEWCQDSEDNKEDCQRGLWDPPAPSGRHEHPNNTNDTTSGQLQIWDIWKADKYLIISIAFLLVLFAIVLLIGVGIALFRAFKNKRGGWIEYDVDVGVDDVGEDEEEFSQGYDPWNDFSRDSDEELQRMDSMEQNKSEENNSSDNTS